MEYKAGLARPLAYARRAVVSNYIKARTRGNGSAILCAYHTNMSGLETTTGFLRYSTKNGKPAVVSVFKFRGQSAGDISLYWVNSTGNILVGGIATPSGIRVGVINGQKFTPLPGITALGAAAW